ncbi:MAG: GntR family transcriptional regulator [Solirubrobacteraceae bacterium]
MSAVAAVLAALRDAILTGEMPPGEPLDVRSLAEQLGVSHIPIREALRQLEIEGLIVAPPRRKPEVAAVTVEELSAIYELRTMVEVPTARRAVERSTAADLALVRKAFGCLEKAASDTGSVEYWEAHRELHRALIAAGSTPWGQRILESLWQASERYVRLFVTRFGSPDDALWMHRTLMEAYETGVPDILGRALTEHFAETERIVRDGYRRTMAARSGI